MHGDRLELRLRVERVEHQRIDGEDRYADRHPHRAFTAGMIPAGFSSFDVSKRQGLISISGGRQTAICWPNVSPRSSQERSPFDAL